MDNETTTIPIAQLSWTHQEIGTYTGFIETLLDQKRNTYKSCNYHKVLDDILPVRNLTKKVHEEWGL